MVETTVSATAVRRLAVAAQGYSSRYRRATESDVEAGIRSLSCVQLDSISTVERSHRIALTSRVGNFPRESVSHLLAQGRIFEFWAHEACLLPIEAWPLFRRAMNSGGRDWYSNVNDVKSAYPELAEEILARIREDGPLASRQFEGAAGAGMWNWKPAKAMLERLWNHGVLVIAGRQGFQRVYDLAERVIPRAQLDAPVPSEHEALRTLAEQAVRARGALTEAGIEGTLAAEGQRLPHQTRRRRARRGGTSSTAARGRRRRGRAGRRRRRARPARGARRRAALAVRQPALGPPVRATDPRLRPPDRGLQARARSGSTATTSSRSCAATGSSAAPISSRSGRKAASSSAPSTARTASALRVRSTTRSTQHSTGSHARSGWRRCAGEGQPRGGTADRGAGPGTRRLGDGRPPDRAQTRVPPDRRRPARRATTAPRPLQPAWLGLRPRGARPVAVGGALALRVERVHLPARGSPARSCTDPVLPPLAADHRASGGCTSS